MHHPTDRIAHTTAFVTPVVEHWLERVKTEVNVLFNNTLNTFTIIWHRTARKETLPSLYGVIFSGTPSNTQGSTYHSICYTSCEALAGMRNSSGQPSGIDLIT